MSLQMLPLALTVLAVAILGIVAIVCSTSGGADWLQRVWKGEAAVPDADDAPGGPAGDHGFDTAGDGPVSEPDDGRGARRLP